MATFVLVPGAWLGAWAWDRVTPLLRDAGHEVHPVSLSGLGERAGVQGSEIDLDRHIQDVVDLMESKDLSDVILVGHSYAGMVVAGAADRAPGRIGRLVYLDTFAPVDGSKLFDFFGPEDRAFVEREAAAAGDASRWPMPRGDDLGKFGSLVGLTEEDRAWMHENAVPHPLGTFSQPLNLTRTGPPAYPRAMIMCTGSGFGVEQLKAEMEGGAPIFRPLTEGTWDFRELPTGHWPMFSMPKELAALLLALT
jgi:pimeloyl-ACP methyl ester carboxylesterase